MTFTNKDIKEQLQDAINEMNNTNLDEVSAFYLIGYMQESIRQAIAMIDRMELDERYRRQEENEFLAHLGK